MDGIYKSTLYKKFRGLLICILDTLGVLFCYIFTFFLHNNFFLDQRTLQVTPLVIYGLIFIILLHVISQLIFRTHKILWAYTGFNEVLRSFLSSLLCTVVMISFSLYFHLFHLELILMAEFLAFLMNIGVRFIYRALRRYSLQTDRKKNALIVGAGGAGYVMLNEIYRNKRYPFNVVGFLDDYKKKGMIISGKQILGTVDEVGQIAREYDVDQIFIAIQSCTVEEKRRVIQLCTDTSVNTKIMSFSLENEGESNTIEVEDIKIEDLLNRPSIDLKTEEIGSYLTDKVVCVTGAGGSIGSELCRQILKFKPKQILLIDINENSLYMLEQEILRGKRVGKISRAIDTISLIVSIREREEILHVFERYKPEVVYHAAAHKHVPLMETRPSEAILNNVFGTKNVIDACMETGVNRFIMISTDKAVNPTNVMGATKRMTELVLQSRHPDSRTKMAAVRFGNVLGSNGSVIPIFKEQIKQGGPVTVTHRDIQRYFMTIPEAAQLVLQAGYYADQQEIFVLDMGQPVKIIDLAEKMVRLAGFVPYEDIEIQEIGLRPGEKMFEELSLEIEKCHKTDNNLIFVHEPIHYSQQEIDEKLDVLKSVARGDNDPYKIKETLMKCIQE